MLQIRKEQHRVFSGVLEESWVNQAIELIRKHWPGVHRQASPQALREQVARTLEASRAAGITAADDAFRYLNLTLLLGDDFAEGDKYPWAAHILRAPIAGPAKIALLIDKVNERIEREANA